MSDSKMKEGLSLNSNRRPRDPAARATAGLGGHFHSTANHRVKVKGLQSCEHIHLHTEKSVGNFLFIAPAAVKTRNSVLTDPSGRFC